MGAHKVEERRSLWRFGCRAEVEGQKVADEELMATVGERPG